jgi:hypothetical protein
MATRSLGVKSFRSSFSVYSPARIDDTRTMRRCHQPFHFQIFGIDRSADPHHYPCQLRPPNLRDGGHLVWRLVGQATALHRDRHHPQDRSADAEQALGYFVIRCSPHRFRS